MWEAPKEGFLSIEEQERLTGKTSSSVSHTASKDKPIPTVQDSNSTVSGAAVTYGPAPKVDVYSSWQTVQT